MAWSSGGIDAKLDEERKMLDAEPWVTVTMPKNPIGYISSPDLERRESNNITLFNPKKGKVTG